MNMETIEETLRKAPPVRTPAGLLDELQADINLAQTVSAARNSKFEAQNKFRLVRWMPALGFALWFLGCVVVFGIQASRIAGLRAQQRAIESAQAAAAQQAANAEAARAAALRELEQLKRDLADVQRLRAELEQLRAQAAELATVRAQNQQLRNELKTQTAPPPKPEEDFFAMAQERADKIRCVNSLKQLGLAARMWANESKSNSLPDATTLKMAALNALDERRRFDKKIFVCPADETTAYEILGPGAPESQPEIIYSRCPIHNAFGLSDGSVQLVNPNTVHAVKKGEWWFLEKR